MVPLTPTFQKAFYWMNKLYASKSPEAGSCQNGPILGTKWNTSLCWKHSAVKWSKIIVGSC